MPYSDNRRMNVDYVDVGEMALTSANDANVPVICFINEPEGDDTQWSWTAVNFMPRKERCGGSYEIRANSKAAILEAVNKYVTPLYDVAAKNLRETGKNYYWQAEKSEEKEPSALAYC